MVTFRSRRLETLLGGHLGRVSHAQVEGLVAACVGEDFDLDFKAVLYRRTDQDRRSLAGDVAAMANTAGGIIILGIQEDDQGRATAAPGVEISDDEVSRMRHVVASLVAPMPVTDILSLPDSAGSARGFLIIAVMPSPSRPHAVLINDGLRFPVRNGATTRYLSEPEVASAYRDRFARARSQDKRVVVVEKQLKSRLVAGIEEQYWVLVSLVPEVAGELLIDPAALVKARTEMLGTFPMIVGPSNYSWYRAEIGRRRLLLSGSPAAALWLAADLYDDGAGAFGVNVVDIGRMARDRKSNTVWLHDEQIVNGILTGLRLLGRHARDRAAASGSVLIRAHLYPLRRKQRVYLDTGARHDGDQDGRGLQHRAGRAAESAALLDSLADDGPGLVAAAFLLATDILQDFGLAEAPQLTRSGEVRSRYWTAGMLPSLAQWTADAGITVTDELMPGEEGALARES